MLINLQNSLTQTQGIEQTYAASASSAGAGSIPVKNTGGFTNQWAQQIGQTGEETAEIMIVSGAPSGTVLNFGTSPSHTAGTLLFSHAQDTPIYQIHYDQVILFRSTAGTIGPFGALGTYNIQPDSQFTQIDDTGGAAGYAYYGQYYNSLSGDLSGTSSVFLPGGPTYYSLQKMRQRVKDKLYSAGYIRDDTLITDWLNEAEEDMVNAAIKVNQEYMLGTGVYGFGTAGTAQITDTTFIRPIKFETSYDGGQTWILSTKKHIRAFSELDSFLASQPFHVWTGENTFRVLPSNNAGSARVTYAVRFTPMVNDSDTPPVTLQPYTKAFVEYCLSVAYGLDQKDTQQQEHYQKYLQDKQDFISQITPRDMSSGEMIDIDGALSGREEDMVGAMGDFVW